MSVLIETVELTKSKKCYIVQASGVKYFANLDSGLNTCRGQWIEAEIKPSTDPKYYAWIGKWTHAQPSAAPQVAVQSAPPPLSPAVAAPSEPRYAEPSDNIAPWFWPSVSNICSSAIAHGLITKPEELNMWALKWAQVCIATKEAVK